MLQFSEKVDFLYSLLSLSSDALFPEELSLKVPPCSLSSWAFKGYFWTWEAGCSQSHTLGLLEVGAPCPYAHNPSDTPQAAQVANLGTPFQGSHLQT